MMRLKSRWIQSSMIIIVVLGGLLAGCQNKKTALVEQEQQHQEVKQGQQNQEKEVASVAVENTPQDMTEFRLGEAAKAHHVLIGAAIEPAYLEEKAYADTLKKDFTVITPENRMKWQFIHPQENQFTFEEGDVVVAFARENNMQVRGHALVWHIQNPTWLTHREWSKEELSKVLKEHIHTVVDHYKDDIYAWDVVNEAFEGGSYRESIWYKTLGKEYIEKALIWAREADPDVQLFLNDYGIEEPGVKADAMYNLCVELLEKNIPLDGVGFQFHMDLHQPFDMPSVYKNLKRFADLGLKIDITELDIRMLGTPTEALLALQAEYYGELMDIALDLDALVSFTLWGFTDKYSWVPGYFSGQGWALIYDENYQPKPAYATLAHNILRGPIPLTYGQPIDTHNRQLVNPLKASYVENPPVVDGRVNEGEWDNIYTYGFSYNQLDGENQCLPADEADVWADFKLAYHQDYLYGCVQREDNITINNIVGETYKNDNVEVFLEYGDYFKQFRTVVGHDFENGDTDHVAVWNGDGTLLEFKVKLPETDMTGLTIGFNIALSDNDSGGNRNYQLYPITGMNKSYLGRDLTLLLCEGDTPRPANFDKVIPPIKSRKALIIPTIDGQINGSEWSEGVRYNFAYDLLEAPHHAMPKKRDDLYGTFKINHSDHAIFGYITRMDDITIVESPLNESDSVELWMTYQDQDIHLSAKILQEPQIVGDIKNFQYAWDGHGQLFEFYFEVDQPIEKDTIIPLQLLIRDNDGHGVKHLVSPFFGGKTGHAVEDFGELQFVH